MKKLWYIVLIISIISSMFITVSADTYDTKWTMTIKGENDRTDKFSAGDVLTVDIINSNEVLAVTDAVIKFTYNSDLLEYDKSNPVCGLSSSDTKKDVSFEELNTKGLFRGAFATATSAKISEGQTMYKVYFKVKEDIPDGITSLNFRWIHTGDDKSYVANGLENYNIEFVDGYTTVKGKKLLNNPDTLGTLDDFVFVPYENPTPENPEVVNLNGKIITLTTPYIVVFSKLFPANSECIEAGVMISETENNNMNKNTDSVSYARAEKFTSNNRFGILFYGNGIKAGTPYYVRACAEYEDFVIYSDMLYVKTKE